MHVTTRPHAVRVALCLVASFAFVACGDDDDDDGASATDAAVATTVAADSTEAVDTTTAAETTAVETSVAETAVVETTADETTMAPDTAATAEGVTFTSAEGDYTVVFPGEPTTQTQPQPLPDGTTIDLVLASYELDDSFIATARAVYPEGTVFDVPIALQGAQDQSLVNTGGTLIASQDITLQGRPGREFSASVSNGGVSGTLLQRVYLDGLVIYQQIFTGEGEATFTDPELATFFGSFAFTTG